MRIAYADPPYPGMADKYPERKECNHRLLIAHLREFDGWALSTASTTLHHVLPYCPDARIGAWCRKWTPFRPGVDPAFAWEPVLFVPCRNGVRPSRITATDWVVHASDKSTDFHGVKPIGFAFWVFSILRAEPGDELTDLFPGTGNVARSWDMWIKQTRLPLRIQEEAQEELMLTGEPER